MKKIALITVAILLAIVITWQLTSNKKKLDKRNRPAPQTGVAIPVQAYTLKSQVVQPHIHKTGSIAAFKESKVFATVSGNILQLNFNLGSAVSRGQVVAVQDHSANSLILQKEQENVTKTKADLDTYTELLRGKATTEQKVKDLTQNYSDAVNQAKQTEKQVNDASIKAPISGIISTKDAEAGVFASPGMQIATIVDIDEVKVQVNLNEDEVYKAATGQTVKITTNAYPGYQFTGKVSFISPQADAAHNYLTEIILHNTTSHPLRSGTFVNADFITDQSHPALLIPRLAVTDMENPSVYVVKDNKANLRNIKAGQEFNGWIEITGGLHEGDTVIVSGQINLKNGSLIRVSN